MGDKVCTYHKVKITSVEEDLQHMGQNCVIVEAGGDLGGITQIQGNGPISSGPFDDNASYDLGTILPWETADEAAKRKKILGIPITSKPKSA